MIEGEVHIAIPEAFQEFHPNKKLKKEVFWLLKTLYGLH